MHPFIVLIYMDSNDQFKIPQDLLEKVIVRIEAEKQIVAYRRRFTLSAILFVGAIFSLIPAWGTFRADLVSSGFGQYLQLLFSDFGTIMANWQDFGLTLLESIPIIGIAELLLSLFSVMVLLKFLLQYSTGIFKNYFQAN